MHRLVLQRANVEMIADVSYRQIDDEGLHISVGNQDRLIKCDSIVLCAGQLSVNALADDLKDDDRTVHVIGGASFAGELDAQRAIEEHGGRLTLAPEPRAGHGTEFLIDLPLSSQDADS